MFDNNGSYNIYAMAFAAKERPDRARGYEVVHHQPCGDGKDDDAPTPAAVDLKDVPVGSFWKTRNGRKAEHQRYRCDRFTLWPAYFTVPGAFLPGDEINLTTTRYGRASADHEKGYPDHEWDIIGPWTE